MNKKILVVLLLLLPLYACNKPLEEYVKKEQLKKEFKVKSDSSCPLGYLDSTKDFFVATIYFQEFSSITTNEDNKIIKDVANIHSKCPQDILLIGHSSDRETQDNFVDALSLSFNRVKTVKQILEKNKIFDSYINILFCGNSNNMVKEDINYHNYLYNQRVDIIFLNTPLEDHKFDCIPTSKLK